MPKYFFFLFFFHFQFFQFSSFIEINQKKKKKLEVKCATLSLNESLFLSTEIDQTGYSACSPNYYVFQSVSPYSPIQGLQAEAICKLNNDNVTASWNIIQLCEPTCLERGGKCDHDQVCAKPSGENIERCFCAGYVGKYCENVDSQGFFFLSFFIIFFFVFSSFFFPFFI